MDTSPDLKPEPKNDEGDQGQKLSNKEALSLLFIVVVIVLYVISNIPEPTANRTYTSSINCNNPPLMGQKIDDPDINKLIDISKADLGRSDATIIILKGLYRYCHLYNAGLVEDPDVDNRYYIFFDDEFYKSLTPATVKTVVAHELGHLNYQIDADNNAIKYFGGDAVIEMLNKVIDHSATNEQLRQGLRQRTEFRLRMENAERAKNALQKK